MRNRQARVAIVERSVDAGIESWSWSLSLLTLLLGCTSAASTPDSGQNAPPYDGGAAISWREAAPCPIARFEAMSAVVGGQLWVMGGFLSSNLDVTRRVDIYDPVTDSWRAGPDLPGAETHVGVATVGGDIVLAGGFEGAASAWATTAAVWRWSASDDTWTAGPDLPVARSAVAMAAIGTAVHVAGGLATDGSTDSGDHSVWDLAGAAAWTSEAPLPNPRNHGGGAASGGLFFAIAGRHGWDEVAGDTTSVDAFDPATGGWTARAAIPTARSEIGGSTSTMSDGRILVVGGSIAGVHPSADVLIYDPSVDRWSALRPLPSPRKGAVAARIGPRVVVTTGSPTSTDPAATTYVGCCF